MKQERFDYTKWSQNLYGDMSLEELLRKNSGFERKHPELNSKGRGSDMAKIDHLLAEFC